MSTHKHFDKICCVVLAFTLIISVLFINAEKFGVKKTSSIMGYETTIFDNSKVHTIDIVMDNWDDFIQNCRSEEYYNCSVVIDNEAYKNVAIRGKGNTSLSSVDSYGNNRYSFKIEFDHYDSTNTYYGLDKLVLNNMIQDNTYMKDYLTYQMMNEMGVASPLCSYVYITVNGEEWGLYLAVEGIEESFLQRNYGKDYGELYKPDSLSMGGGRGNGNDFDIDSFMGDFNPMDNLSEATTETEATTEVTTTQPIEESTAQLPEESTTQTTEPITQEQAETTTEFDFNNLPEGMTPPDNFNGEFPEGMTPPDDFNGENPFGNGNPFGGDNPFGSFNPFSNNNTNISGASVSGMSLTKGNESENNSSQGGGFGGMMPPDFNGENPFGGEMPEGITPPTDENGNFQIPDNIEDMFGGGMGIGDMGSNDVKLQYSDDSFDSYSNIFDNAKTDITKADKNRLIEALKKLGNGEDLENTVDIEEVIRYFVVHNFVVNGDSYTGSMIHNYYLYENDGQMQMIPWDYNLSFGGFMSMGGATGTVNDPIDTPLSVTGSGDRPMIDWIFSNQQYTELYHQYFNEFIEEYFDSGYFESFINITIDMISPYVEKDPTKFCTYDEFQKGIATLKEFCLLRAESVKGQLDGSIGSTSDTQKTETLIDADSLNISDMGSMGDMGGKGGFGDKQRPQGDSENQTDKPESENSDENSNSSRPQMPGNFPNGQIPGFENGEGTDGQNNSDGQMQKPEGDFRPDNSQLQSIPQATFSTDTLLIIGISILVLALGIVVAFKYKKRKN